MDCGSAGLTCGGRICFPRDLGQERGFSFFNDFIYWLYWVLTWRREWQPTLVFLPEKSHGQRSLVGYSPWMIKESDMTERLTHWVFIDVQAFLQLWGAGATLYLWCAGFSLWWLLLLLSPPGHTQASAVEILMLQSTGSIVVVNGFSCFACGIFPDQGWNPCPLHRQVDSLPLSHQRSPQSLFIQDLFRT